MDDFRRRRLLYAMAAVADEHGVEDATVARVVTLARVSRRTFYELFDSRGDCLLAAIEQAVSLARTQASEEWTAHEAWLGRVRAALYALLEFFDREPQLARLCFVYSNIGEPAIAAHRKEIMGQLAILLDSGRQNARYAPPALTAEALVGGALSVIQARLLEQESLVDLAKPLMSFISNPYYGAGAARRELRRQRPALRSRWQNQTTSVEDPPSVRMTYRTVRVLSAIAAQPGLSNRQVGELAEVTDQGQISKLLNRLACAGLVENLGPGQPRGGANAWRLTAAGRQLADSVTRVSW